MEKLTLTQVDNYKGIDIFFNKEDSSLFGENKKTKEVFSGRYLFEIKKQIDEPKWEICDEKGFIKDGTFCDEIYLVSAKMRDIKSRKCKWQRLKSTGRGYEKNRFLDWSDKKKIYSYSKENIAVFQAVEKKEQLKQSAIMDLQKEIFKLTD